MSFDRRNFIGRRRLGLALVALATVALSPAVSSGDPGRCISTSVPHPVVLPDGTIHPPGDLRICYTRAFSPVAGLHATSVNGRVVGLFVSRTGQGEAGDEIESPFFVFRRNPRDELLLEGYADIVGDRLRTYLIRAPGPGDYDVISHWTTALAADRDERPQGTSALLLAAVRH